ncbi:MAG: hypothetical protein PHI83_02235 [Sphaerochaetaceae bacterium]|nr:hypothetical protein [Sphaerochaetaceae bacterium]
MKKLAAILIVLSLAAGMALGAISSDARALGRGSSFFASFNEDEALIFNPASLYFMGSEPRLNISFGSQESFSSTIYQANESIEDPRLKMQASFVASNIALSIGMFTSLADRIDDPASRLSTFTFLNTTYLQIVLSYGLGPVSGGLSVWGGRSSQRVQIPIHEQSAFSDYLTQSLLGSYSTKLGSDFFGISAGFMAVLGRSALSIYSDNLIDTVDNVIVIDIPKAAKLMSLSYRFSQDRYDKQAQLRLWCFDLGIGVDKLFDPQGRSVNLNLRTYFQISTDYVFNIGLSFESGEGSSFLQDSRQVYNLGFWYERYSGQLALYVPSKAYAHGLDGTEGLKLAASLTIQI